MASLGDSSSISDSSISLFRVLGYLIGVIYIIMSVCIFYMILLLPLLQSKFN